jgi:hypothetical protein
VRSRIKRLEREARGNLASFELLDGSRYYFNPTSPDLFLHWYGCATAGSAHSWPEPPEILRKLTQAKDLERAAEQVRGEGSCDFLPYDIEVLISERRLEPRPLMSRYNPTTAEHELLDPYEHHLEDLSES